jgi:hypothetical protein
MISSHIKSYGKSDRKQRKWILIFPVVGYVSSQNCEDVYCHFGLGFVVNRMPTIAVCASNGVTCKCINSNLYYLLKCLSFTCCVFNCLS